MKLMNKKITSKITPKGKMLEVDYSSLEELVMSMRQLGQIWSKCTAV